MTRLVSGADLAAQLRAAASEQGVPLWRFLRPLTHNPTQYMQQLELAKSPRLWTVARIDALITGKAVPELDRQIVVTVPHSVWCWLNDEARLTGKKIAPMLAEFLQQMMVESKAGEM